ncbi:hypothetical protein BKA81DRAFT_416330 [Phyllosticta paracitricarpa]
MRAATGSTNRTSSAKYYFQFSKSLDAPATLNRRKRMVTGQALPRPSRNDHQSLTTSSAQRPSLMLASDQAFMDIQVSRSQSLGQWTRLPTQNNEYMERGADAEGSAAACLFQPPAPIRIEIMAGCSLCTLHWPVDLPVSAFVGERALASSSFSEHLRKRCRSPQATRHRHKTARK